MQLPWVSRRTLEAAECRLRWTEKEMAKAEESSAAKDFLANHWRERAEKADEDNKLLLDRIVQMSGQPPIFHPLPAPAVAATPEPKTPEPNAIPAPATRLSPMELQRMARRAIDTGQLDKPKAAVPV